MYHLIYFFILTQPTTSNPTISPTPATLPKDGYCSDNTGRCSVTDLDDCTCNTSPDEGLFVRKLIKGEEHENKTTGGSQRRNLAKKTPSPTQLVTSQPTKSTVTPPPTSGPTREVGVFPQSHGINRC